MQLENINQENEKKKYPKKIPKNKKKILSEAQRKMHLTQIPFLLGTRGPAAFGDIFILLCEKIPRRAKICANVVQKCCILCPIVSRAHGVYRRIAGPKNRVPCGDIFHDIICNYTSIPSNGKCIAIYVQIYIAWACSCIDMYNGKYSK